MDGYPVPVISSPIDLAALDIYCCNCMHADLDIAIAILYLVLLSCHPAASRAARGRRPSQAAGSAVAPSISDSGGATESPTDQSVHRSAAGGRPMVEAQQ